MALIVGAAIWLGSAIIVGVLVGKFIKLGE